MKPLVAVGFLVYMDAISRRHDAGVLYMSLVALSAVATLCRSRNRNINRNCEYYLQTYRGARLIALITS